MGYWDDGYFEPSRPRPAKGGIKAQSRRGSFGKSWWARRWIEILESFPAGARLGRGRNYARAGQVLSITVNKGLVTARVQGSRVKPYTVVIEVKTLPVKSWRKVIKKLAGKAAYVATLLAGEMPRDIEAVFAEAGLSLFPTKSSDLKTDCSCPDWANPCKHIAAVYYLLGEEFDRDPFLIFKLRGLDREELIASIYGKETSPAGAAAARKPRPLTADPASFWGKGSVYSGDTAGEVPKTMVTAALPKSLAAFPFWQGEEDLLSALEPVYKAASHSALKLLLGEWIPNKNPREN